MRKALIDLFRVLDQPLQERDPYLEDDLNQFPYVNGGLFSNENIEIPKFTEEIKETLLAKAADDFDWSDISPTIFGAVFESTLNPETRRAGGMHYTSIENIHKVIDPLFLDDLRKELDEALAYKNEKTRNEALDRFQEHIGGLNFLDPACGSGNFLTETYLSLRRMENEAIAAKQHGRIALDFGDIVKVHISQFYGIEINDFAVKVATTALWIAESQMLQETEKLLSRHLKFLPLKTYTNIIEGNALSIDWNEVISNRRCNYLLGNPPFLGARLMSESQKKDIENVFKNIKNAGNIDYVGCWYKIAAEYMKGTQIEAALVSTNSICQGEQPAILWKELFKNNLVINFAHRTFRWDSEASIKAHVHCIIVGFSYISKEKKYIYDNSKITSVKNINAYLVDAPNIFIENRSNPIQKEISKMDFGSMPNDGGYLSNYSETDYETLTKQYPDIKQLMKRIYGAEEFINNKVRYCLWLYEVDPALYRNNSVVMNAIKNVRDLRLASNREATRKLATIPYLFGEIRQPKSDYLLVPSTSSERRRYIPIGFMDKNDISTNANLVIPNASLYEFGILTSNVHMSWMRAVAGRLKSDYRYSAKIVYNNFPWPNPTSEQKEIIEKTAKLILEIRKKYSISSLADLYDEITMPSDLRKAHQMNDKAVMQAYGFSIKMTESECVAKLMEMYQELVNKE